MTSPMHQQPHQPATTRQTVFEDMEAYVTDGMPVYDLNGEKVGDVKMYSLVTGYLQLGTGPMEQRDLYIPFRLIRSIDPHEVFVSEYKVDLMARYSQPPTITTVVEHRLVPGPSGSMTPQTCEVEIVHSGYDDQPTEFNRIDLSSLADRLAVGMVVYDVNGERLGDITDYDVARGSMVVEKGIFKPKPLSVPLSAIREIHPGMFTVYLSLSRDAVLKTRATWSAGT